MDSHVSPAVEAMPKADNATLNPRRMAALTIILLLAFVPLIAGLAGQPFYVTLISRMMIFALAALGLNLILGYGGMVSFGHALYIGIGAYAVGILSFYGVTNGYAHVATALIAGLIIATPVGMVCLRTSGIAFIMITLAFAQMFYFVAVSLKQLGGDDGYSLPSRSDFGIIDLSNNTTLYYVIFVVLLAVLFLFFRLIHAPFGVALCGCKQNERRMRAMGFSTGRIKLVAYVISALVCVLSGVLLANLTRFVSPSYMNWVASGDILLMVVLGGMGTLIGPIVGAIAWLSLEEILSSFSLGLPWGIDEFVRDHWMIVLGALVIVAALHLKSGLYGYLSDRSGAPS
ncbi:MAG: ABC-type branched-chain amino acid transport system, permease component [Rhizobium sp.]|nr:ABC-type branched-chain amino acid transport system, permease component [Rhizobium sp.]